VPVDAAIGKKFVGPEIRNSKLEIRSKFEDRIQKCPNPMSMEHEIFEPDLFFELRSGMNFWNLAVGELSLRRLR